MRENIKKIYYTLNVYERNVFGCFYDINQPEKKGVYRFAAQYINSVSSYLFYKWERYTWKALSCCACRNRSIQEQKKAFSMCREDCHRLLDGELHLCARSSHGTDLGLIEKRKEDFALVRRASGKKELKKQWKEE